MSRQIPGYYYDEEKRRYFKIQPNHAVPAGSTYSADKIKSRELELESASEIARTVRRRKRLVRHAGVLQDPFLGSSLSREHGQGYLLDGIPRAFVKGWDGQEIFPSEASPSPDPRIRALNSLSFDQINSYYPSMSEEHAHLNASTVAMGAFHFDPITRGLFYPLNGQILCGVIERKYRLKRDEVYTPVILRHSMVQLSINDSLINSINVDPKTRCVLTTWRAPTAGHNIHLGKLETGEVGNGHFIVTMVVANYPLIRALHHFYTDRAFCTFYQIALAYFTRYMADILGVTITSRISSARGIASTLWSTATTVSGSPFTFAIATDTGVIAIDELANYHDIMKSPIQPSGQRTAVLAVECLPQHPYAVLAGTRSGLVMLLDVRERRNRSQPGAQAIHPSSVYKIKQVNDYTVVVAGLNSTLCNYDLRFLKRQTREQAWPNRQFASAEGSQIVGHEVSQPLLLYPKHRNSAQVELGFDVDLDAGIVAAAQYDPSKTVSIFSVKTGHLLRSLNAGDQAFGFSDNAEVKALNFVQEDDGAMMKSLWVAKGTRIIRFAW